MPVTIKINANLAQFTQQEMGRRLAACVVFYCTQHQQRLGKSNPFPHLNSSKPGEYPRKRTGFLQKSVAYSPVSIQEITSKLDIKVGYDANAFYGPVLEVMRKRLGLVKTLEDLKTQLGAIVGQPVKEAK
jgi:hypothetical protein